MNIIDSKNSQKNELNIRSIIEWYFGEAGFCYDEYERNRRTRTKDNDVGEGSSAA